jgi:hypothetical protein
MFPVSVQVVISNRITGAVLALSKIYSRVAFNPAMCNILLLELI